MGALTERSPTKCIAQREPPRVPDAIKMRTRLSPRFSARRFDIMTQAVKAPRIAIVVERITKVGSCGIMGRNLGR
jgi:hypothetical protein